VNKQVLGSDGPQDNRGWHPYPVGGISMLAAGSDLEAYPVRETDILARIEGDHIELHRRLQNISLHREMAQYVINKAIFGGAAKSG
jgi:hypothetical protein